MQAIYYTYLIKHKVTNKVYYGSSYSKKAHPKKLWVSYFTSSKVVKSLINEYGKDSFDYEIRKTFDDPIKCRNWEALVLNKMNAAKCDHWLNKHNGGKNFCNKSGFSHKSETIVKMKKPKPNGFGLIVSNRLSGVAKTDEHKRKLSNSAKLRWANPEERKKQSLIKRGSIPWNKGLKGQQIPWNKGLKKNDI